MDIETINTLTVIGFGNICLIFVLVWIIQTWREEFRRNGQKRDGSQK
ncbi:MAG: hypothetical protein M1337_05895 [Actinobacteria bacterium]|nr:hypothetical protein [Actinomycetota bacterium]